MGTATQRRLDLLEAEVATLRRRGTRRSNWRKRLPLALVALLVALVPLGIAAAGPTFSDLGEAAPVHQANIQAIGDAGITTGFDDPANPGQRTYSPKGLVTREEMASFLARTAGLGSNAPIVNAKTAQTAGTATNAGQLGGVAAALYALKSDIPTSNNGSASAMTVWYSFFNLTPPDNSVVLKNNPGQYDNDGFPLQPPRTIVTDPALFGAHDLLLPLAVSTSLRVSAVHICYATPTFGTPGFGPRIDRTALVTQGENNLTQYSPDNTVRQSHTPACYDLTLSQPVPINGVLYLRLRVNFANQADGDTVVLYGARLTLVP